MDGVIDVFACKKCGIYAIVGYVCCEMAIVVPPIMCDAKCGRPAVGVLVMGPLEANSCRECANEFARRVRS